MPRPTANLRRSGPRAPSRFALLVASLAFVLAAPSASAVEFERAEVVMTPNLFSAGLYGEQYDADAALALRQHIDNDYGDGDGLVIPSEVNAYVADEIADLNGQLASPIARSLVNQVRVNDRAPIESRIVSYVFTPALPGSSTSNAPFVRDVHATMTYATSTHHVANISFAQNIANAFPQMSWDYALLRADAPWVIDVESIDPGAAAHPYWTGDGFNVTYAMMSEFSSYEAPLAFELEDSTYEAPKKKDKDSPAPGAASLLLLVIVALFAWRRR